MTWILFYFKHLYINSFANIQSNCQNLEIYLLFSDTLARNSRLIRHLYPHEPSKSSEHLGKASIFVLALYQTRTRGASETLAKRIIES